MFFDTSEMLNIIFLDFRYAVYLLVLLVFVTFLCLCIGLLVSNYWYLMVLLEAPPGTRGTGRHQPPAPGDSPKASPKSSHRGSPGIPGGTQISRMRIRRLRTRTHMDHPSKMSQSLSPGLAGPTETKICTGKPELHGSE